MTYPALPLQQGMVFNSLRFPEAGVDLVQCVIRWPNLDLATYRDAWRRAVARHPILRTGFRLAADTEVVQDVHPSAELDFSVRDQATTEFLAEDRARGFAFDTPPLVRVTVLTGGDANGPAVVITLHHSVLDGRSLALLLAEVDDDYLDHADYVGGCDGHRGNGRAGIPHRPAYHDFVTLVCERGDDPARAERDRAFWTEHLAGVSAPTPLPFGHSTEPGAGRPASVADFSLSDNDTAALRRFADTTGVTLNTLLLAAWARVLGLHSAADDVVVGMTRSARYGTVPDADQMVGMLLATVPLRIHVDGALRLDDWLRRVRRSTIGVRDHQLTPLTEIQRCSGDTSGTGLMSSLVLFDNHDLATTLRGRNPSWRDRAVEMHRQPSYPLTVYAIAEPTLRVSLTHDRLTPAEAEVLTGQLRAVLLQLAHGPHGTVRDLSPVDPDEHLRVVSGGSDTPHGQPETTVPELFAEQVRRSPDAPAVYAGHGWWSYAELAERSTRIAHAVRARGIGVDEPVGVALPRGAGMIAAFLGVLQAGAAYLPLDPNDPPTRTATVLADAGARLVLTDGGTWPVESLDPAGLPSLPQATPCPARPDTLAYLTYTSGSTGVPKGVAVPHRAVVRLVQRPNFATVGPGQTFLHASASSFDATTFELWGALLTGARVVPVPPGPFDATTLATLLRRHRVSVLWLTAGLFHQLVEHDVTLLSDVDQLLAGGDVLAPDAVRAALTARGGRPVVNGYGPTENTTFTACHVMRGHDDLGVTTPIGTPVQHTTVYVLDQDLRPVPTGVAGELCTGGAGLARGYLGRPALTAAKFVPDPFGPPGSRMYRTGDQARRRPDGTLEFLGRTDSQIKIRGYLVDPGETESVLRRDPRVGDAAVAVVGTGDARRLVAYLTPSGGQLDINAVRARVAATLPTYLRPAHYTVLDQLPLNANGKVDRARLPEPADVTGTAPASPLRTVEQRRMAGVWTALLGVRDVGADDDFFALGGNSLSAMRLTFRIREAFGVTLPIREIYRTPTLATLTSSVTSVISVAPRSDSDGIVRRDRADYRVPTRSRPPEHLVVPASTSEPLRHWALWRWVELRGAGFDIEPVLDLADQDCAAAADRVVTAEEAFVARRTGVLDDIRSRLRNADPSARPALRRASRLIRKGRLGDLDKDLIAGEPVAELLDAAAALEHAKDSFATGFTETATRVATVLGNVAGTAKFREAVAWQNPRALRTAVDTLHHGGRRDNTQYRQRAALVTSYLQRYTTKNDTIGFFGPVGWARITGPGNRIDLRPGPRLLANRSVYLESWAVQQLAEALTTETTRRWAVPRRLPFVGVDGDRLRVPLAEPVALSETDAAVLGAVDGARTAEELATSLAGHLPAGDVYATLAKLRDQRRIAWTFEVSPAELNPEVALRDQLERIGDERARAAAIAALDELVSGRDRVAEAAGDPDRLADTIAELHEVFTRHTGESGVRRPGQSYAGRTLVHEDCRRDLEVTIGEELLPSLTEPLSLLLESARWFTSAGAALFRRALRDVFRSRVRTTGQTTLRLADFWLWANDIIFRLDARVIGRLTAALQERWASILPVDRDRRTVQFDTEAIRDKVCSAFAAPRPGWRGAVQHSPDIMVAARDADAVAAGDFQWVLGELHAGVNTMRSALFVSQHPNADQLRAAMASDLAGPRVVLAATREEGGTSQRLADALIQPRDIRVVSAHDACGPDLAGATLVADLLLSETDGKLVAHDHDGGNRMDLVELLHEQLMGQLVQHFRPLPAARHTPRVSIDRLVISRETWRMPARELAFAFAADSAARFLGARAWRAGAGLPRFLFAKSPVETKPFFVDLASTPSVEQLAHAVRALDRERPDESISVSEMLPTPEQLWLTDADGGRYTAELRLVAVDRRGSGRVEGQS